MLAFSRDFFPSLMRFDSLLKVFLSHSGSLIGCYWSVADQSQRDATELL
jgi:hypothetical protein